MNSENAGRAIPVNFSLGTYQGLGVIVPGYPTLTQVDCKSQAPVGRAIQTTTAGNSGLSYDASSNTYTYVWKTDKNLGGTCQLITLLLVDGSDHLAFFQFK